MGTDADRITPHVMKIHSVNACLQYAKQYHNQAVAYTV